MTVKKYLEGVLKEEEYTNSFEECANEVYRVYNHKRLVSVSDVAEWLRGLPIGVDFYTERTEQLAAGFLRSEDRRSHIVLDTMRHINNEPGDMDGAYWFMLAHCIWDQARMTAQNPQWRGLKGGK